MSDSRPSRLRVSLLATLAALAGIAVAGRVPGRTLPVRVAAADGVPSAGGARSGAAHAAFAAG